MADKTRLLVALARLPKPLTPPPVTIYPFQARGSRVEGTVIVVALVTANGSVSHAVVATRYRRSMARRWLQSARLVSPQRLALVYPSLV
jgi:hypothetical protein